MQGGVHHRIVPLVLLLCLFVAGCGDSGGTDTGQIPAAVQLDPDLNADGIVTSVDLSIAGGCVGRNLTTNPLCRCADTDGDNDVDTNDLRFVSANIRRSGYPIGPNPCVDPRTVDDDRDGLNENQGDCNDNNPQIRPGLPERCNGVDDNCNTTIDEGFALSVACTVSVGACARTGVTVCAASGTATVCNAVPGPAQSEACNGIDDDCDGTVDDGFQLGVPCTTGLGECQRSGQTICAASGSGTVCDAMAGAATVEACNGLDDDCDGSSDEDFNVGSPCTLGVGACEVTSTIECTPDGTAVCQGVAGPPSDEACNLLDDNCDGTTDEGFDLGTPCSAGVGACERTGSKVCANDGTGTVCGAAPGEPSEEICENGVDEDCDGVDRICTITVTITSPAAFTVFGASPVEITGTVDSPLSEVQCYGFSMFSTGGTFSGEVPLREGNNTVTCLARDIAGHIGTASTTITLDTVAPSLTIQSPSNDSKVLTQPVAVTGMVNDITVGTVNDDHCHVTCNGVTAAVANRSFLIDSVPLAPGDNTITCTSMDRGGNTGTASVDVTLDTAPQPKIVLVSGSNQTGIISQDLPAPLVVQVQDGSGGPVAGKNVVFRVTENDGVLHAGGQSGNGVIVVTDASGMASASFTLGTRVGAGNHKVQATAVGFAGEALFVESALPGSPALIVLDNGNNQEGMVTQALPWPFVVVVVDEGNNRLEGIPVTFRVLEGGGSFAGQPDVTIDSDTDGRAQATLTLGPAVGMDNNLVEVTFFGNSGRPVTFVASGQVPGDPADTSVSGVVLDNQNEPIEGATLRVEEAGLQVQSDAQGRFFIKPVPVGLVTLTADGSTVQRPGTWPRLQYELVTVAGQDNTLGMPVYLLPLDVPNGLFVDATHGGTLTFPQLPGFSLTVAPGSATFPNGSNSGTVSVTLVHNDKMPMPPGFGQQPRFIITIQPSNTEFHPPAPICIPNSDSLSPGEKAEMYSYDHDMGQFVSIGTGTVTTDGVSLCSDPGVGILKGGWHCGGNPSAAGTVADCPDCQSCDGSSCVPDPSLNGSNPNDSNTCCFDGEVLNKYGQTVGYVFDGPLENKCPERTQNRDVQHDIDGCSGGVPPNEQDPMTNPNYPGGLMNQAPTAFGRPIGTVPNAAAAGPEPCNQHDICYQTCTPAGTTLDVSRKACDDGMKTRMDNVCSAAYPSSCPGTLSFLQCGSYFIQRADCFIYSGIYWTGLRAAGFFAAYKGRQEQYCQCCP